MSNDNKVKDTVEKLRCAIGYEYSSIDGQLLEDAADAIESLTRQLAEVTAERDAAVEDLKTLEHATGYCLVCKYSSHGDCHYPNNKCGWQWRGVKGDAE